MKHRILVEFIEILVEFFDLILVWLIFEVVNPVFDGRHDVLLLKYFFIQDAFKKGFFEAVGERFDKGCSVFIVGLCEFYYMIIHDCIIVVIDVVH